MTQKKANRGEGLCVAALSRGRPPLLGKFLFAMCYFIHCVVFLFRREATTVVVVKKPPLLSLRSLILFSRELLLDRVLVLFSLQDRGVIYSIDGCFYFCQLCRKAFFFLPRYRSIVPQSSVHN